MGYSATTKALKAYERVMEMLRPHPQPHISNVWLYKGRGYFADIGRENADGSVTGSVCDARTGENVGSFRIEPSGTVARWSKCPKAVIEYSNQCLVHAFVIMPTYQPSTGRVVYPRF